MHQKTGLCIKYASFRFSRSVLPVTNHGDKRRNTLFPYCFSAILLREEVLTVSPTTIKRACLLILSCIMLTALSALDGGNLPLSPRPSWVEPVTLDPGSAIETSLVDSGYYYILNDQQRSVGTNEHYRHFAFRVLNSSGLEEASRIEILFESDFERLSIHGVTVWREEKALDWTKRIRWQTLQRESSLDYGLYDESKTMLLVLEDVRPGDVVEYDYTIAGENPIFGTKFYGTFNHGLDYPMSNLSFRLLVPAGRKIAIKHHVRSLPQAERSLPDGSTEIRWVERDSPAVKDDYATPSWHEQYPWIEMSEWKDWTEVRAWGRALFDGNSGGTEALERAWKQILDGETARKNAAGELAPGKADSRATASGERAESDDRADKDARHAKQVPLTREERLIAALRFVQDDIRYFGIEIGVNSHRPRNPEETLDGRFGDCKDKALLFCRLARLAGWEAWPVLVNTGAGRALDEWLPSPRAFDHVIACVRGPKGGIWFDPTVSYQGGTVGNVWVPDYGKGLVLDGSPGALKAMPAERGGSVDVHETYSSAGYDGIGTLEVVSIFRGREADRMRYELANTARSSLEKSYLEFYQSYFPKAARAGDITSADNRAENVVEIRESYSIAEMWTRRAGSGGESRELYVFPYAFSKRFSDYDDIGMERTSPLAIPFRCSTRHRITVKLPESLGIKKERYESDNPWYRLDYDASERDRTFELDYRFEPLVETVPAADYAKFRSELESDRKTYLGYTLSGGSFAATKDADDATTGSDGEGDVPSRTDLYAAIAVILALTALVSYRLGIIHGREDKAIDRAKGTPPGA